MRRRIQRLAVAILLISPFCGDAQTKVSSFKMQDVKLQPSVFKSAEEVDLKYIMSLNPDRLLSPFLREAGLQTKAESYPNWENTGLDGHIGGHYLSALSLMYASNANPEVLKRLNYMLTELKRCQNKNGNGYIGGVPGSNVLWAEIAEGKIAAGTFDLNQKWVPLYNIHKTFSGLRDAYYFANSEEAKTMLVKFADWMLNVTSKLSDQQVQLLLKSEHGGLNEVFADVSAITGDKKYLRMAERFSHQAILDPLAKKQDKLNNMHANTQIPKVIGFERIASLNGDQRYHTAAEFFWDEVVNHRSVAIGGNSVREHFHPANNYSSMLTSEQGPETCNTYNMLKLTKMLFEDQGWEKYIDYYERALYNHILSTQHPVKGGFVYFTPMRPGHYRVYSQPQTSFWCCVGSGMENHAKYSELIYAHTANDLYVNLFIPSTLNWKEKGLILNQQTDFPEAETTTLTINSVKNSNFTVKVRYPAWVAPSALSIKVNGQAISINSTPGSYVSIARKWKKGDKITIKLPMRTTTEQLPDGTDYFAVLHGPLVLAAKTGTTDMTDVFADDSRMGHVANGKKYPLQNMPMFVSNSTDLASQIKQVPGKGLTFSASNLIYPERSKSLALIPFYKLYDARYIIYWQKLTPEKLQEVKRNLATEDSIRQEMEAITVDMVVPGEQQPESDHFIASEESFTGVTNDVHWRAAKGWFSYQLLDKGNLAKKIRLTYHSKDKGKQFKLLVNGELVQQIAVDAKNGQEFYEVDYEIPAEILKKSNGKLVVRFEAVEGSTTAQIFGVRLLKK